MSRHASYTAQCLADRNLDWDVVIMTPTYRRGALLRAVVDELHGQIAASDLRVLHVVFNDGSPFDEDYRYCRRVEDVGENGSIYCVLWNERARNYGRARFWMTLNTLWSHVRDRSWRYAVQIPDDWMPCHDFLPRIIERFDEIRATDTIVCAMNLLCTLLRNWGTPRYLDNAFIADRRLFDALNWELEPITKSQWRDNPQQGSGTGAQVTRRVAKCGHVRIAPVRDVSWLRPIDAQTPSEMFPKDKRPRVWWRNNFVDKHEMTSNESTTRRPCRLPDAKLTKQPESGILT